MKLLKTKSPYLDKLQLKKVLLATSIMTLVLYVVAMIFSLCGSDYFILKYQNPQMDGVESWFRQHDILALLSLLFLTFESTIILSFSLNKIAKWWHVTLFYAVNIGLSFIFKNSFQMIFTISQIVLSIVFVAIDKRKQCLKAYLRLLIGFGVSFLLQVMIYVIKAGYFSVENHILTLSAHFIYSIESDIALLVILYTISLYINREKGDSELWVTAHTHGGFSQTSTKQSQMPLQNLTKTQKSKLFKLYAKLYLIQIIGFTLLMVLPFLLGKVFEFLVMYTAFAVVRYILGFKYSLHYKKESICITVGVVVFGILALAVPFFTVLVILAVILGASLAILLHLSYKYKSMWLFSQVAKPDKFALLYTFFDGDLSEKHVKNMCKYKGLTEEQIQLIFYYTQGEKISYIAWKFNYSQRMTIYKIDEAIDKLIA